MSWHSDHVCWSGESTNVKWAQQAKQDNRGTAAKQQQHDENKAPIQADQQETKGLIKQRDVEIDGAQRPSSKNVTHSS